LRARWTPEAALRILIFNWKDSSHPAAGGAEEFTEQVARSLVLRGHQVTLFASSVDGRPGRELVSGVDVIRRGSRLGVYKLARRFWRERPAGTFDVVIDEINTRPFMTPRWIRDTPIVALIHQLAREIWFYETPFPLAVLGRYVLEPWWLRAYRVVPALTVSRSSAESLARHHGWRDVTVIPEGHGSDAIVPTVSKEHAPTVVFLGRLVAMKRPADAIAAFQLLAHDVPSAKLWLIGDGPLLPRLRVAAPASVEFLGRIDRDQLSERLARAHVIVATSVREGWGLNISEAAACGTPAIGYAAPGLVDSIQASGGALVDPRPEALAEALRAFFSGRLELRPSVSTLPWSEVAAAVETRLQQVIERWRATGGRATSPNRAQRRMPV
jgi:glycosyltransferase involved in cell wall biosynthesis